jgi:hypothetical protein
MSRDTCARCPATSQWCPRQDSNLRHRLRSPVNHAIPGAPGCPTRACTSPVVSAVSCCAAGSFHATFHDEDPRTLTAWRATPPEGRGIRRQAVALLRAVAIRSTSSRRTHGLRQNVVSTQAIFRDLQRHARWCERQSSRSRHAAENAPDVSDEFVATLLLRDGLPSEGRRLRRQAAPTAGRLPTAVGAALPYHDTVAIGARGDSSGDHGD